MSEHFLSVADWTQDELLELLARSRQLRRLFHEGERPQTLQGRTLAMYFEKPSLRTHVTFEAGMNQMGGHAILLRPEQVGIGTRESPRDVARNLSRWVDCIMARTYSHDLVTTLAAEGTVPVINGLTDLLHPCQAMADLLTMAEKVEPKEAVLAWVGDGNNVANSLMLLAAVLGFELRLATPKSHQPALQVRRRAAELAGTSGARIEWTTDPGQAVRGAHFVYTDTWTSMGQEDEAEMRRRIFSPYQVNAQLVAEAGDPWVMHCLPAHRGEEITDEILDGPRSLVYEQAENRLHAQKAILERLMIGHVS
jgi:ornithine carbamoyltransferase